MMVAAGNGYATHMLGRGECISKVCFASARDWGRESGRGFYSPVDRRVEIGTRMLMYGFDAGFSHWDIPDGMVESLFGYLTWLGGTDMTALDGIEKSLARIAISQCQTLSFTNAVPALKAIGLNPNGLYRWDAISLAVTLSPLDTNLVGFVETV